MPKYNLKEALLDLIYKLDNQIEICEPDESKENIEISKTKNEIIVIAINGLSNIINLFFPQVNIEKEIISRMNKNS